MIFNSGTFFIFFILVFIAYWSLNRRLFWQNLLLTITSYIFYGWWSWRFLILIMISTVVDYVAALLIERSNDPQRRKLLLLVSIVFNLGMLGIFKYFNFFAQSFVEFLQIFNLTVDPITLNVILPVGISFYTFQTMSYTIDVYRKQLKPTRNFISFAAYVSFFPQLVAGPIERATHFLPQIESRRVLLPEQAHSAIFLIIWGLLKKVAIADQLALVSNQVFQNHTEYHGLSVFLAVLAFSIQIYCDFSGYSDIARGVARLLGFELSINFRLPYFALNPTDFWNRWHISLSTWLRDYLYIPLGGNRGSSFLTYRNLFLTMLIGGLWHGAAWNFVIWGAYHGLILILFRYFDHSKIHLNPWSGEHPYPMVMLRMGMMFLLTLYGWLLFRAESFAQIVQMTGNLFTPESSLPLEMIATMLYALPLLLIDTLQYYKNDLLIVTKSRLWLQPIIFAVMILWMILMGNHTSVEFIYFQF